MPSYKPDPRHTAKQPDNRCKGKVRGKNSTDDGDLAYCPRGAGWGTDHAGTGRCKHHGGAAPTYKVQVEQIMLEQAVEQYGLPTEVDPHDALLGELYRTQGHVEWLRLRVAELETDDMTGPVGGGQGGFPSYEPSVWIRMYRDERTHLAKVAKSCIDAGIAERQVRIVEGQAQLFAGALQAILIRLNVQNHPEAPQIVREELLKLEGGEPDGYGKAGAVPIETTAV